MKILVINGVNLNMLGIREKNLYGSEDYAALVKYVRAYAKKKGYKVKCFQSNGEGDIVTAIQRAYGKFDGIVINAGAYTHTSVAILDALKAVNIPTAEVHLTDIYAREQFRHVSYISLVAKKTICGKGFAGYAEAMDFLAENR
ncbi:MAG: type II 3-dehydroquinate dehydratase [Bacillota bacterium]|nr:MAG: type II 3-dehydroquinate dehydratase [Bacillota bacterium]